jgi:hypothetical protein
MGSKCLHFPAKYKVTPIPGTLWGRINNEENKNPHSPSIDHKYDKMDMK